MIRVLFCVSVFPVTAMLRGTTGSLDLEKELTSMQPEVVAHLLAEVEKHWEEGRVAALMKHMDETTALAEMTKSCAKVTKAIIGGSDGDKDKVVEYMHDVCTNPGSEQAACDSFATEIEGFMSNDAEVNRNDLDLSKFCSNYWNAYITKAASVKVQKLKEEDAARAKEEEEKKKQEAEEIKAQEAAAAQKAKEEAEAKEAEDLKEAESLSKIASDDDVKISAEVKETQAQLSLQQTSVDDMVDKARKALQIAAEKEAQAAEPKAPEVTPAADEVAAKKAGDSEADRIAEKAIANAQKAVEKAEEHIANDKEPTLSNETAAAVAAGDKLADKIAAKAAMLATKTSNKTAPAMKVDVSHEVFKVFFRVKETKKNVTTNGTAVRSHEQEVNVAFNEKPLVDQIVANASAKEKADKAKVKA
eukprot:gnl/MRDRNA2_/MRDRNA2_29439_c0_seq1.p1 gnl/MRDRNA2_/MRDRNA2_29439_c0~~gnl/MRDRNA2_/MRDRNA2_29439_c0_seq1.p1  ORF type:complete len:417 (+),score=174.80 gnl/MRDRNA2_/MRDRNA2_29439_c0_seq1:94-1344(+)